MNLGSSQFCKGARRCTCTRLLEGTSCSVTCLGVTIDSELTFAQHIKRVAVKCFHQLRQLWTVRRALSVDNTKKLVHVLVSSRVDYCNSVLYHVATIRLRPLQSVINAAAGLIVKKRKFDHIRMTIRDELHWLPVEQRLLHKQCLLMYKCQCHLAPSYLSLMCMPLSTDITRRHLCSVARGDLIAPRTKTVRYGPRSFAVSGPSS